MACFEEMARANEGIWMWDAVDSSCFVHHAHICMALGDMLGSAKLNGMAGHSAIYGDYFSMVKTAHASVQPKAKYQYYPISPPEAQKYNPDHPKYDLSSLPMCTEYREFILEYYWTTSECFIQCSHHCYYKRDWNFTYAFVCSQSCICSS